MVYFKSLTIYILFLLLYNINCKLTTNRDTLLVQSLNSIKNDNQKLILKNSNYNRERRNSKPNYLDQAKDLFFDTFVGAQSKYLDKYFDCIPGSYYYNRSCYYLSSKSEQLTWLHAEKFCRLLPVNATLLVIRNEHEFNFLKAKLIETRQKEFYRDQLVFNIGFNSTKGVWRWINNPNTTFKNLTELNLANKWSDWEGSLGGCGSIVVKDDNQVVLRSAPCHRTDERFICTYILNACLNNTKCGKHGRCVNLYTTIKCQCTSMFFEGKYCEKYNATAIQMFIGVGLVGAAILYLILTGQTVRKWLGNFKSKAEDSKQRKEENEDKTSKKQNTSSSVLSSRKSVKFKNQSGKPPVKSMRETIKRHFKLYMGLYDGIALVVIVLSLTLIQIMLIHAFKLSFKQSILAYRENATIIRTVCNTLQRKYLSEEVIYLPMSLFVLGIIVLSHSQKTKRYSNYITRKYYEFFKTPTYREAEDEQEKRREDALNKRKANMTKCQLCCFNTRNSCCFKCFCCLFCCTCCGHHKQSKESNETETHGCMYNCCCKPIMESDFCKVMRTIRKILAIICCWDLFCCIRKKINKKLEEKKEKDKEIIDGDEKSETDKYDDEELIGSSRLRFKWPLPLLPFSTVNRFQSVAIYVAYTYDIINIFMYLYSSYFVMPVVPIVSDKDGVIKDFVIQLLQVVVIGFKFYPILAMADLEPKLLPYICCFFYVATMWLVKTINKGFCSRTEAFVKFAVDQFNEKIEKSQLKKVTDRLNLTYMLDSQMESEESKYRKLIKEEAPKLFAKIFGSKSQSPSLSNFDYNPPQDDQIDMLLEPTTTPATMYITQIFTFNNSYTPVPREGFRKKIANKSLEFLNEIFSVTEESSKGDWSTTVRNLLENLPLYFCLSYLAARFFITVVELIIARGRYWLVRCMDPSYIAPTSEKRLRGKSTEDQNSIKNLIKFIETATTKQYNINDLKYYSNIYAKEHGISKYRIKNHNYDYISNILQTIKVIKDSKCSKNKSLRERLSFTYNCLFKIYKPVKYFRYSKQFMNTYTVAIMVIYFFTVFLLRSSNIFGDKLIRGIEVIYQFVTRGLIPSFDFQKHNLFTEFTAACLLTSFVLLYQLLGSIKSFQNYVVFLHRGGRVSYAGLNPNESTRDNFLSYFNLKKQKKDLNVSEIIAQYSLHFPGYLVAHLVYSYFIVFLFTFIFILIVKILYYVPQIFHFGLQIFLPLTILLLLKIFFVKFLTRTVFVNQAKLSLIPNLAPYYIVSYFNFFFDCFLGFFACISRVWQTTIISLIYLPRLDKTMFNEKDHFVLQQLDKGHLAFINFVHMEHLYNNPVLIGFCDVLVELMFWSYIREKDLKRCSESQSESRFKYPFYKIKSEKHLHLTQPPRRSPPQPPKVFQTELVRVDETIYENRLIEGDEENQQLGEFDANNSNIFTLNETNTTINTIEDYNDEQERGEECENNNNHHHHEEGDLHVTNKKFKYGSYRRLCNIFYLYILLKNNPVLVNYTIDNLKIKDEDLDDSKEKRPEGIFESIKRNLKRSSDEDDDYDGDDPNDGGDTASSPPLSPVYSFDKATNKVSATFSKFFNTKPSKPKFHDDDTNEPLATTKASKIINEEQENIDEITILRDKELSSSPIVTPRVQRQLSFIKNS